MKIHTAPSLQHYFAHMDRCYIKKVRFIVLAFLSQVEEQLYYSSIASYILPIRNILYQLGVGKFCKNVLIYGPDIYN